MKKHSKANSQKQSFMAVVTKLLPKGRNDDAEHVDDCGSFVSSESSTEIQISLEAWSPQPIREKTQGRNPEKNEE